MNKCIDQLQWLCATNITSPETTPSTAVANKHILSVSQHQALYDKRDVNCKNCKHKDSLQFHLLLLLRRWNSTSVSRLCRRGGPNTVRVLWENSIINSFSRVSVIAIDPNISHPSILHFCVAYLFCFQCVEALTGQFWREGYVPTSRFFIKER